MHKHEILRAYRERIPELHSLGARIFQQLQSELRDAGIDVHTVSYRIKSEPSLRAKIARPDRIYTQLHDLSDVIGLRVVTYFEDSIEAVAQLVERRFSVDPDRSIDKRIQIDPSSFGYRSLHYVCHPLEAGGIPFEIQIRTILQHAWAEIEHDLGYKFPEVVPQPIRRRFSRLAGLLEIADAEFVELRRTMESYEQKFKDQQALSDGSSGMDLVLLRTLVASGAVQQRDRDLAHFLDKPLAGSIFYPDYLIKLLHAAGLVDAKGIVARMEGPLDLDFVQRYFAFTRETWGFSSQDFESLQQGYSLFLLAHSCALEQAERSGHVRENLSRFFQRLDYPQNETEARRVADLFLQFCQKT